MFSLTNALLGALLFLVFCTYAQVTKLRKEVAGMLGEVFQKYVDMEKSKAEGIQYIMNVAHFNSLALRHALNALRPYVISIMNNAAQREDFKEAQICKDMIAQIDEIIKKEL